MIHARNFVKCEINDFNALLDAINYKNNIENQKKAAIAQVKALNEEVQKLNAGKFTFGSMFKSTTSKQNIAQDKVQ